jgi:hypothetical protein
MGLDVGKNLASGWGSMLETTLQPVREFQGKLSAAKAFVSRNI